MRVVNSGIGANLISTRSPSYDESGKPAASERLEKHVLAHDPDLLIISYGLNDARGGTPLPQFREDLALLVRRVREHLDPLILLPGPYFMTDFTVGGGGLEPRRPAPVPELQRRDRPGRSGARLSLRRPSRGQRRSGLDGPLRRGAPEPISGTGSSPTASSRSWPGTAPAWRRRPRRRS